jgi:hypothetical protein
LGHSTPPCPLRAAVVTIYLFSPSPTYDKHFSVKSMGISQREFIRWLPDEASEPTATLVVTSPGRRFVDIRVLRPEGASNSWPEAEGISFRKQVR